MQHPEIKFAYDVSHRYWECCILAGAEQDKERRAAIWAHWEGGELAGLPVDPQPGFWRVRRGLKGARRFVPVWVNLEPTWGIRVMVQSTWDKAPRRFWESNVQWLEPVSYDDYSFAIENGRWPTDLRGSAPSVNWNAEDPAAEFRDSLILLAMEVEQFIEKEVAYALDDITANKLANWRSRLAEGVKKAEELRTEEVKPLNEKVKAVNELWRAPVDEVKELGERIKKILTPYLAIRKQEGLSTTIGGQEGRKVGARTEHYAIIDDWALAAHSLHEHPKVREAIQSVANANARHKGFREEKLPGITYTDRPKAV